MDSDRILVMDTGTPVELGHPYELLKSDGYLRKLAEETGKSTLEILIKAAHKSYADKKNV